ncbi:hypothetical protein [Mycobacteroides abscessus]|uniref:hypothetical protein n=1 Tax=Mycobacteroides abscessus TaxID=36809 RepID=UPI0009A7BEF7|nr:hypothetical protein [Mycobacteroides abscessus]SKF79720.1 Uncharacterised protein [Mycobacteroides abscessus subsp. bolletii]SKG57502.1 Uncharacterised protein [Mycobacteroides abscessus subsp. bolletii]SKG82126.1 Uncharacterised protein [Mycobacteroides abscessus subsp. bolletii]SKG94938.1 Uncharacterised protein [Mycobacteroides abscessus subsp. bolletii]SKH25248.1 Uncharacterised protein [Mycobacteroides abscessus subsp. bolletii]
MAVQKRDAVADTVAALETKRELLASLGEDTSAIDAKLAEWRADDDVVVDITPPVENKVAPAAPEKATPPASENASVKPGKAAPTKATAAKSEPAPAQAKTEETKAANGGPGNDN